MKFVYLTSRGGTLYTLLLRQNLRDDLEHYIISNKPNIKLVENVYPNKVFWHATEQELSALLDSIHPDLILSAGYNKVLSPEFCEKYHDKIINIHPGLSPGYDPQKAALKNKDKRTGNLVHFLTSELDNGTIISSSEIPIYQDDNYQSLNNRLRENSVPMLVDVINNWEKVLNYYGKD